MARPDGSETVAIAIILLYRNETNAVCGLTANNTIHTVVVIFIY